MEFTLLSQYCWVHATDYSFLCPSCWLYLLKRPRYWASCRIQFFFWAQLSCSSHGKNPESESWFMPKNWVFKFILTLQKCKLSHQTSKIFRFRIGWSHVKNKIDISTIQTVESIGLLNQELLFKDLWRNGRNTP